MGSHGGRVDKSDKRLGDGMPFVHKIYSFCMKNLRESIRRHVCRCPAELGNDETRGILLNQSSPTSLSEHRPNKPEKKRYL